jgi:hypothetical protein
MAKRKITVATKNEQIYKLSFELTKPFSGDEYDLLSARPILLYYIISKIRDSGESSFEQSDIKFINVICDKNPYINKIIEDLYDSNAFLESLLLDPNKEITNPELSTHGEYNITYEQSF